MALQAALASRALVVSSLASSAGAPTVGALWACLRNLSGPSQSLFNQAQPQASPQQEAPSSSGQQQASNASTSSSSASEQASTSGAPGQDDLGQKVVEGFKAGFEQAKTGYEKVKSKIGSEQMQQKPLLNSIADELRTVLLPNQNIVSVTRRYTGPVMEAGPTGAYDGPSALVAVQQQQSAWQKAMEKLGLSSVFGRLRGGLNPGSVTETAAYRKGQELVEDLREKYETSDHPMVHKVEEVKSRVFAGSEASRAMREIRMRNPGFDMIHFLQAIKLDAPLVTRAVLRHDLETLSLHCGPELMQRFEGIFKHYAEQGLVEDPTLLFVGDVEVVEVKLHEDDPFIIAQFHCQQLKCTRDKFGNVVEGAADSIQRVYYFWGLQQERESMVTADGRVLPPRWVIKDMMWQSMLALV